jgi:hypothetical protein
MEPVHVVAFFLVGLALVALGVWLGRASRR